MSKHAYYLKVSNARGTELWWGSGGAELMDEIDPLCRTEVLGDIAGPFMLTCTELIDWADRASAIPGWRCRSGPSFGRHPIELWVHVHTGARYNGRFVPRPWPTKERQR